MEAVEVGAADSVEVVSVRQSPPCLSAHIVDTRQGQDILESLNADSAIVSKKEKQQLKHEAFIDRAYEA